MSMDNRRSTQSSVAAHNGVHALEQQLEGLERQLQDKHAVNNALKYESECLSQRILELETEQRQAKAKYDEMTKLFAEKNHAQHEETKGKVEALSSTMEQLETEMRENERLTAVHAALVEQEEELRKTLDEMAQKHKTDLHQLKLNEYQRKATMEENFRNLLSALETQNLKTGFGLLLEARQVSGVPRCLDSLCPDNKLSIRFEYLFAMAPGKRGPKRKADSAEEGAAKKPRPKKTGPSKKAAMIQCVQDNLSEIQQIQAELEQLAKERDELCQGDSIVLRLVQ
ncbi:hypothetical protein ACHHYP_07304 [Achlya hypogyna]|uniref:Cilia- and flagella-associated protein 157 n=1 Tax=Achlya hypogyna TaxID=1202772 RepID=A0A1V9YR82_ACHHY|nr:hypothetical protein ACHHYP_07304 [Achlya hypogyna]